MHRALACLALATWAVGCGSDGDTALDAAVDGPTAPSTRLGFNAKGLLDTTTQVQLADQMLAAIPAAVRARLQVRVTGGTTSQVDLPADWSDPQLDAWVGLQKKYGIGLVYVVNGNDTPASQAAAVARWIAHGARFTFLEMMNEYYLPRYRDGPIGGEVSRLVTPASYVTEILPAFLSTLGQFALPTFIICAPRKTASNATWNDAMVDAVKQHSTDHWGVTLHLYDAGGGAYDYQQISDLRDRLPPGTPIAVTEAGVTDPTVMDWPTAGARVYSHYQQIATQLHEDDFLFDQILFSNYQEPDKKLPSTLHPDTAGLTPKGEQVIRFIEGAP